MGKGGFCLGRGEIDGTKCVPGISDIVCSQLPASQHGVAACLFGQPAIDVGKCAAGFRHGEISRWIESGWEMQVSDLIQGIISFTCESGVFLLKGMSKGFTVKSCRNLQVAAFPSSSLVQ